MIKLIALVPEVCLVAVFEKFLEELAIEEGIGAGEWSE
ncbi:MAG: hypothetical protein ACI9OD_003026 [Limisphaerales bacterium]|jgi:hypothetical protein